MRLLIVEDDNAIRSFISRGFVEEGHAVDQATDLADGLWKAKDPVYDCIVLDRTLPSGDGLEILRNLRVLRLETPVLVLTARDAVTDRVEGLRLGADDYLIKPFTFDELLARVEALMRRRKSIITRLALGDLLIDRPSRLVTVKGKRIDLTAREYAILEFLAQQAGEVVSRTRIYDHVWNEHIEPASNTIDVHIRLIRKKLNDANCRTMICTIRGAGYRME